MTANSLLPNLAAALSTNGLTRLTGAPEGCDALAMAEILAVGAPLFFVAREETRMARAAEALSFFAPDAEIITLPAWDCLPYDRVPPHADVAARRLAALTRLAGGPGDRPRAILTTVSAVLQRVPPRDTLAAARLDLAKGSQLPLERLSNFLLGGGYRRAATVREPGEFAVRGGIVDVFPPGQGEPVRLDFFGDDLDGLRGFDALSQRTTGTYDTLTLVPASEILLDDDAVGRFRKHYREQFGAVRDDDILYETVSAGSRHPGMEHWLPLFYPHLDTLFDYLPADAAILLDDQCDDALATRLDLIQDYYEARRTIAERKRGRDTTLEGMVYNPLAPNALYLAAEEWSALLGRRPAGIFSGFAAPQGQDGICDLGGRRAADFTDARSRPDVNLFDTVRERFRNERRKHQRILVTAYSAGSSDRLKRLMQDHDIEPVTEVAGWREANALSIQTVAIATLGIETGFTLKGLTVLTERDILGDRLARRPRRTRRADDFISEVSSLNQGDLVVHADHGIGRYEGLETLDISGAPHDCLRLVYAGNDKLFLPVENLEILSRFGSEDSGVPLDRLGGSGWQARKAQVKQRIRDIARKLLQVAAARQLRQGPRLTPQAGLYEEFVARFPFPETDDQDRAIGETLDDLASGRPMDRLICGDVGFGKTEVALRAAFVTAMTGQQVAIVVPTTLLARQHYRTFTERFAGLPIQIAQLSRLVAAKDAKATREGLANGRVDIVIGTHTLLAKSIKFRDLALLVVDEEQHFGVSQKERLKQLRNDVHVLTLTATPIPRTLQLALTGVRELSLIATPPVDRLAVRTFILPYDPVIIREAIMREHFRGGQIFYVCPRLQDIAALRERLQTLVPEVKIAVAHGQLPAAELESVMGAFYEGQFQVLLSTNIVESGLDIPTANTIVIHRADMFGLAQLYQLRGRVGRSKTRAYAYLTLPTDRPLSESARKRLDVMQTLDTLGAGFSLASHDLDIRGAGNLLGDEQSGHIKEVGVELYQQMLEEAVAAARDAGAAEPGDAKPAWTPTIAVGTPVLIPEPYVQDLSVRLGLYRRIANLVDAAELDSFAAEMIDRFGPLPSEVENLLSIVGLKQLCRSAGVEKLDAGPKGAVVTFRDNSFADPAALVAFITSQAGTVKLRPDHKLVYRRDWVDEKQRLQGIRRLMTKLGQLAGNSAQAAE